MLSSSGACVEGMLDGSLQGYAQSASGKMSEELVGLDQNYNNNEIIAQRDRSAPI